MSRCIDFEIGQKINRLTIISKGPGKNNGRRQNPARSWICKCDCGNITDVLQYQIRSGHTKSCGCLCLEINAARLKGNKQYFIHGLTHHPLRAIRKAMIDRCYNQNNRFYKNYGGRGITVCEEWKESLPNFVEWALANGWVKRLSIDRIDNNGNYNPENCHWITISENSRKTMLNYRKEHPEWQPTRKKK